MTKLANTALLAALLLASASVTGAEAAKRQPNQAAANSAQWTDLSDPYGGYSPNSAEGNRAFWDYQGRHGGTR